MASDVRGRGRGSALSCAEEIPEPVTDYRCSSTGRLAREEAARVELGSERVDIVLGARPLDAEGLDEALDQVIARCPLGERNPEELARAIDGQVTRLTQIERD